MRKSFIFHPFLFSLYAILAPFAHNIADVGLSAIRTLIVALFFTIVLVSVLKLIFKHQVKASLVSSALIILFFTFGHLEASLPRFENSWFDMSLILLVFWGVLFGLWVYWVTKKLRDYDIVSNYFNIVGLVLMVFPLYSIFTYSHKTSGLDVLAVDYQRKAWRSSGLDDVKASIGNPGHPLPDVYYIIVDGYTSTDVLKELFGYDNSYFIRSLEERGFYVAKASRSNYKDTVFSISSSLNMVHINTIPEFMRQNGGSDDTDVLKETLSALIRHNLVRSFLQDQGYSLVTFDSGYDLTNVKSAEFYEKPPDVDEFNMRAAFEMMLMDTTIGQVILRFGGENFVPLQSLFNDHRKRVLYTFTNISRFADVEGTYFVYAHILSPHTPYVFGPNGEERRGVDPFTLLDGRTSEWRPELYRDQVIFINKLVLNTIDQILEKSDPEPIIILQADHSARAFNEFSPSTEVRMKLLFPILNAYYLPGVEEETIFYPEVTPVNSFRLILNQLFGTNLELLADTSYILEFKEGRGEFVNACQVYQACMKR